MTATLRYYARLPGTWGRQVLHNGWGIANVADLLWLRPMADGLIDAAHPFCTGVEARSGAPIWPQNVIFTGPRAADLRDHRGRPLESDAAIVSRVGRFMAGIVAQSAAGRPRAGRMPPAVNYLHGGVHYNGGWLLFDDFADAIEHFSDPRFAAELVRFVRAEDREPVVVFRRRDYDRRDYARFVCMLRSTFHWFANSNGPKRRVLWGNPAPYASVNIITGRWIRDVRRLGTARGRAAAPRPPIAARYFEGGPYRGPRREPKLPEKLLAAATERRIRARGGKGNLFFVDQRKL